MTREEIIQGLQFTIDMFLFDPLTGEPITKPRNDMDKTTIDACKGAIELLTQEPCEDAISREDALMCMTGEYIADMTYKPEDIISKHIQRLRALPPVQPKPIECEDAISRQAAIDEIKSHYRVDNDLLEVIAYKISKLPSVQPKLKMGHWIPVKFRPLTDEEQKEYPDYCYMADCPMPDDGEEIFVSTKSGGVEKDECGFDDGYYLDSGYDWQTDIVAWMPLPEPYEPQKSEDKE